MGEQPQLDLRIIRRDQHMAGRRDKGRANFAAGLIAHRNVLQIGLGRREPSRGRGGERIARVHATGLGVDIAAAGRRRRCS